MPSTTLESIKPSLEALVRVVGKSVFNPRILLPVKIPLSDVSGTVYRVPGALPWA